MPTSISESLSPSIAPLVLCAILLGTVLPTPLHAQEVFTIDRWHTVQSAEENEIQMRPVALVNGENQATGWRIDLQVPPDLGKTLAKNGAYLDLLIEGGTPVSPSYEVSSDEGNQLTTVQVSVSNQSMQSLADADTAHVIGPTDRFGIPPIFRADLQRIRSKVSIPSDAPSTTERSASEEGEVFIVVEEQPRLIGGRTQLQNALSYPPEAEEQDLKGRVFVQFVVDESGRVVDPSVRRGMHPVLDSAAVRAVKQLRYVPGRQRGEPVKVQISLPIAFPPNEK